MDQNQPAQSSVNTSVRSDKKKWSPLAIVLTLSAAFFAIFLVVSGILFMTKGQNSKHGASGSQGLFGNGAVGVIELTGVIMDSKKILKKLERFEDDDDIKAVVMRLDSPGGAVAPSQEIYQAVKNYKKPIISSMGSVAASGAYYVASGTQKIFANPGTITGSIGVIMEFANLSKLYEWAKVQRYSIKTGKFKDAGAEYRDMTAEEKALLQGMVDDVLVQFKTAVSTGRKLTMDQVTAIADGRIFSGNQGKKAKLVDELGTLNDAINEAGKMAGIKGKPTVVYPDKNKKGLMDFIMDNAGQGDSDDSSESQTSSFWSSASAARGTNRGMAGIVTGVIGGLVQAVSGSSENLSESVPMMSPGIYWLWTGH
jgi:protease-4